MRLAVLVLFLLSASFVAAAQDSQPFLGTWKVSWQGDKFEQEARLVIEANGGSWQRLMKKKTDACFGLKAPIALEDLKEDSVTVHVKYSEALQGCEDMHVMLKKVEPRQLIGKLGEKAVTAVRD